MKPVTLILVLAGVGVLGIGAYFLLKGQSGGPPVVPGSSTSPVTTPGGSRCADTLRAVGGLVAATGGPKGIAVGGAAAVGANPICKAGAATERFLSSKAGWLVPPAKGVYELGKLGKKVWDKIF